MEGSRSPAQATLECCLGLDGISSPWSASYGHDKPLGGGAAATAPRPRSGKQEAGSFQCLA